MHYRKITSLAILLTMGATALVYAEDGAPRKLKRPLEALSLDSTPVESATRVVVQASDDSGIISNSRLPQVDRDGRVRGAGVADRLRSMRRRAVDVNLSRSFFASPTNQTVQHHGELPEVRRRRAGQAEAPTELDVQPQPTAAPVVESPAPTPAVQEVPHLATESVELPTRPIQNQSNNNSPMPAAPHEGQGALGSQFMAPRSVGNIVNPPIEVSPVEETTADDTTAVETPAPDPVVEAQPIMEMETPESKIEPITVDTTTEVAGGVLLKNRAPAITFETLGPRQITIGQETVYKVRMINMGEVDAKNLVVTVRMPAWAEVNSSSATRGTPLADSSNTAMSSVTWEIANLAARGNETLSIGIVPRDSRPIDLAVGWAFNPDQSTAQIEVQEPMLQMDISGPADVNFGETALFSITLANPGTGDAKNVVLNLLPSTQQRVTGSRDIGTLKMGERKTVDIELTAHQAGRLQVRAMAHAAGGLRDEASRDVVVRRAQLEMALLGPPRNFAASGATYKIRVENTGDAVAEDATAVATIPAGATFVAASDSGSYAAERGQVEWHIGAMQPGSSRVLELNCELHTSGENRLDVHCDAARDISIAKSVVTYVEALADLKLYVNDPKGAIATGEDSIYEVRVENRGTKAAEMIQIIGYFSEGIEPVSLRGADGELATGQVVMNPLPLIEPGQSVSFQITARAVSPGNHVFRAELQCSQPETRLAAEDMTKYYSAAGGGEVRQAMVQEENGNTFELGTH